MKKLIIALTLVAFVAAGAFTLNKVSAKASTSEVKIEMVKFDQDPTKDGDKSKKDSKTKASDKKTTTTVKSENSTSKSENCATKKDCPPAKSGCCSSKSADPGKK